MPAYSLLFAILAILALNVYSAVVTPVEYYYDAPKYFPENEFDTFTNAELREAAFENLQYSVTTWFKISRTMETTNSAIMLHLTALNVEDPWDSTNYPSSVVHLANLVRVEYNATDENIYVHLGSFTNPDIVLANGYSLVSDCWHYLYVGLDYQAGTANFGVYSGYCQSQNTWGASIPLGSLFANEALDSRLTLYLGGSKNYITTQYPNLESWPGSLYRTTFFSNFVTSGQQDAYTLMQGDKKSMYFLFLDNTVSKQKILSYEDPNTFAIPGTNASDFTNAPSVNGVDGFGFNSSSNLVTSVTISSELQSYNYISFWVNLANDDTYNTGVTTSTERTILSILTPSGAEFLSIVFTNQTESGLENPNNTNNTNGSVITPPGTTVPPITNGVPESNYMQSARLLQETTEDTLIQALILRSNGQLITYNNPISIGDWHFVFLTYTYVNTQSSILLNFMVDGTQVLQNFIISNPSPPQDFVKPMSVVYFGKTLSDLSFNGQLRNVIGGVGSYYYTNATDTTRNCTLTVGLEDPYCLLCSNSFSDPLYTNPEGVCSTTCPPGTYADSNTRFCVPCDDTCETCSGPGPHSCLSCPEDLPLLFQATCFVSCPDGTLKSFETEGTCECDPVNLCSGCEYNFDTEVTQCVGCQSSSLYLLPDKTECVLGSQCPLGTVGDSSTQSCVSSCASGQVMDFTQGICASSCPTSSFVYTSSSLSNTQCYAACPSGTYADSNRQCQPCQSPCDTCLDATTCITCAAPYLYHEDINVCDLECQEGFNFVFENYFCQACKENCTVCSPILVLNPKDQTCVNDCPIGMVNNSGVCEDYDGVDVKIVNRTGPVNEAVKVSSKDNIILVAEYASSANITSIQWMLGGTNQTRTDIFFRGADSQNPTLVIQSENLDPDSLYTVFFQVTDSEGREANDSITLLTGKAIEVGSFVVTPQIGTAYSTEFTIEIAGFETDQDLKFDVLAFSERKQVINEENKNQSPVLIEQVDALTIAEGVDQGSYKFVFPPYQEARPIVIQLCAYNSLDETCWTKNITVQSAGNLPLQKVIVWEADTVSMIDLDDMLNFARSVSLFYARSFESKLVGEYQRGELLIENLLITKNIIPSSSRIECSSNGLAVVKGNSLSCTCDDGFGGFNCYYGNRDFNKVSPQIKRILRNLFNTELDSSNVEKAILILNELVGSMDFNDRNNIFYFRDIIGNIVKVADLKRFHLSYLFNILGNTIEYVQRPLISTWFKDVDRGVLLKNFTNLTETTLSRIDGIRSTAGYYIADTDFIKVLEIDDLATTFLTSSPNPSVYNIDWDHYGLTLPKTLLTSLSTISIKILGYQVNPYGNVQTSSQITSVMKVEIYDANGLVMVENLTSPITLKVPKIAGTPIFRAAAKSSPYTCLFKNIDDEYEDSFRSGGCQFVKETTSVVQFSTTHLTGFVGQLNMNNLTYIPTSGELLGANNGFIAEEVPEELAKRSFNASNNATTPTVIVSSTAPVNRRFNFPNYGFYTSIAVGCLYLICMLINMRNTKKNSLKKFLEKGQSFLVVTYHPILSLFVKAHTATSNTQNMRLTKFFYLVSSYLFTTSFFYFLLDLDLKLNQESKLVLSTIFALMTTPLATYSLETLYIIFVNKRYGGDIRKSNVYHTFHFGFMFFNFIMTTVLVGFIRREYQGSWVGSFIVTMLFDIMILDFLILIFAVLKNNDSKILHIFRKRGFYVNTGTKAIITQEDIEELLRKARGVDAAENGLEGQTEMDLENVGRTGENETNEDGTDGPNGGKNGGARGRGGKDGSGNKNAPGTGTGTGPGGRRMRPIRGRGRLAMALRARNFGSIDLNGSSDDDEDGDYDREYYIGSLKNKEYTGERPPWKP